MPERETSRDIDRAASNWTARLDRGPLTPQDEEAFQAWQRGDPRRKGALLRAQALAMKSESAQALGPDFDPREFEAPGAPPASGPSRRRILGWAGGAVVAASLVALGPGIPPAGAVIRTGRGEIRLVPLKDGSTVLLNTQSSIRVNYSDGERHVALLAGEAYFSVAGDAKRPFVVEVDGRRLRTAQAGFRVRKLEGVPVDILVQRGRIDLATLALPANTRLTLSDSAERPRPVTPEAVMRDLAWRDGKLAFEGESLKQAADSFARYSDTRIRIRDAALAEEPVTGLFAANDPAGFSRAIAQVFGAKFERQGDDIVLSRGSRLH